MGYGSWSPDEYLKASARRAATGGDFGYTRSMGSTSRSNWKAHEALDPKVKAGDGSPHAGLVMRESRDNDEHPNSLPIAVIFDATGSMGAVPRTVQKKLKDLFGLLIRKNYVDDPQVMVGAYGDAYVDRVPLQISQFESDNKIDENLDNLFVEGGGGGNMGETVPLAWYYLAHHTSTDAFEKRGKKGYAFFIADERALDLRTSQIKDNLGIDEVVGSGTAEEIAKALQAKWEVFILLINNSSALMQHSAEQYEALFGKAHVLPVQDPEAITETIAVTLGIMEGRVDLDKAGADLADVGADAQAAKAALTSVTALATLGDSDNNTRGIVPTGSGVASRL